MRGSGSREGNVTSMHELELKEIYSCKVCK